MTRPSRSSTADDGVLGRATTAGQALPLGVDDAVIAARALRRALADAGLRAVDVEALVLATPPPLSLEAVLGFARRALGPRGATVRVDLIESEAETAADLAAVAAKRTPAGDNGGPLIRLAVGIGRDGTTVALCLGPENR